LKEEFVRSMKEKLGDTKFVLASQGEPYLHYYDEGEVRVRKGTGGVVTALDPIMRACNGTWVSCGLGEADREAVDDKDKFAVPDNGSGGYSLRRIWLSKEEQNALGDVSNGALWPLSHIAYVRPHFHDREWQAYCSLNKRMAEAIAQESPQGATVWINDYQFSLCPKYLREMRPDLTITFFWHVPWPPADVFKICPWCSEIVESLLANDLIGFHSIYYANHFLNTVDQTLEARVDRPAWTVHSKGRETSVVAMPISVDFSRINAQAQAMQEPQVAAVKKHYGIGPGPLVVGVDRMDFTKGIPEKLRSIAKFLERNPTQAGKFTFLQVASPTRVNLPEYQRLTAEVTKLAESINWEYSQRGWKPVILLNQYVPEEHILALYRASSICLVNSLHDGMNLVSKEFVSAKCDSDGVLVLSKFAGAANELKEALLVNPYSALDVCIALEKALAMPESERMARMNKMRTEIAENDVFHWAANFMYKVEKVRRASK